VRHHARTCPAVATVHRSGSSPVIGVRDSFDSGLMVGPADSKRRVGAP
jgi:hypothetical protein